MQGFSSTRSFNKTLKCLNLQRENNKKTCQMWNNDFSFDPSLFYPIVEPANYSSQTLPETTMGENDAIPPHVGTYSPEMLKTHHAWIVLHPKIAKKNQKPPIFQHFLKNPEFHQQILCPMKI